MDQANVRMIPINEIDSTFRLRWGEADPKLVDEIAQDVKKESRVTNAILVAEKASESGYNLVNGLHRFEGTKKAGISTIPAQILDKCDDITTELLVIAARDDTTRKSTRPIETAMVIQDLKEKGITMVEFEHLFHFSKQHLNNLLRLLKLPEEIRNMIRDGKLAPAKGRAIAGLSELNLSKDEERALMIEMARKGLGEGLGEIPTCSEFHRMIQQEKAGRSHNPLYAREKRNMVLVDSIQNQVKKLMRALSDEMPDPAYEKMVFEDVQPLYNKISDLMKQSDRPVESA